MRNSSGRAVRLFAAVLSAASGGAVAVGQVPFRTDPVLLDQTTPAEERARTLSALATRDGARRVLVQFDRPLLDAERERLAAAGVSLLRPLTPGAYFATLDPTKLDVQAAIGVAPVRLLSEIRTEWKIHPLLLAPEPPAEITLGVPARAAVTDPAGESGGTAGAAQDPVIAAYVLFHPDAPLGLEGAKLIEGHGGVVRQELLSLPMMVVEMPFSAVRGLAAEDGVQWVEPALPALGELNASNRVLVQAETLQAAPYSLSGAGVSVLVYDGGRARFTHDDFAGRIASLDDASVNDHPTHVAGTIGGSGAASGGLHRGMAPGVFLLTAGLPPSTSGLLYTNPGDIEADYGTAVAYPGRPADITNNSIGLNITANNYNCAWMGDYGLTDSIIDAMARGSLGRSLTIVWAGGNERGNSRCWTAPGYRSTSPPSGAKNHIAVGAVNSNDDSITNFTSFGPVDDGRLKPDVVAPGCQVGDDGGVTSTLAASNTAYGANCGTSMAAPTVAGVTALLLEDFRARFPARPAPSPALFKALLIHTAEDLVTPGPDYQTGYGSVRTQRAVDFMRTGSFAEGIVGQGGRVLYETHAAPGASQLKITVVWSDPPGTPNVVPNLVNNLDLIVTDPNGVRHYPWTLNPAQPAEAAVRTEPDGRNNVEQVLVDAPIPGIWTVEVAGTGVPDGPQTFSVCASPELREAAIDFDLVTTPPARVLPGQPASFDVRVTASRQDLVAGSLKLHHRSDPSGTFAALALSPVSGDVYRATLPAAACGQTPQFYLSAEGSVSGVRMLPFNAPASFMQTEVGVLHVRFSDAGETDPGWTASSAPNTPPSGTIAGMWNRGVPAGRGLRGDPPTDADGSGSCWLTDNRFGDSDVDNGSVTLTSPVMDASGGRAVLSYARWFNNSGGQDPAADVFRVEISNDNGQTWKLLETVGPSGPEVTGGWRMKSFLLSGVLSEDPGDLFRMRFTAYDTPPASVVEAAVDAVRLEVLECTEQTPSCSCDWDQNQVVQVADIFAYLRSWFAGAGDFDGSGATEVADIFAFLRCWFRGCD